MDAITQAARIEAAAGRWKVAPGHSAAVRRARSWRASRPRVPGYLTKALGPRPERGWGHERWRQGAAAIEG